MQRIEARMLHINHLLDLEAEGKKETTMIDPKVAKLITEFDAATNAIAARIQKLIDAGGLNPESEAALQAEVDKLTALGQDPANPVPTA
jgi:hypothetical protein